MLSVFYIEVHEKGLPSVTLYTFTIYLSLCTHSYERTLVRKPAVEKDLFVLEKLAAKYKIVPSVFVYVAKALLNI